MLIETKIGCLPFESGKAEMTGEKVNEGAFYLVWFSSSCFPKAKSTDIKHLGVI